jgi:chromosome segregation ATPase
MSDSLTREQLEYICEHGVKDGHLFTRIGAIQSILAHDAALRAQLAQQKKITAAYNHDSSELEALLTGAGFTEFDVDGEYKGLMVLLPELLAKLAQVTAERNDLVSCYELWQSTLANRGRAMRTVAEQRNTLQQQLAERDARLSALQASGLEKMALIDEMQTRALEAEATIAAVEQAISVEFAKKDYTDEDRQHKDVLENLGVFLEHHQELEARVTELEGALKGKAYGHVWEAHTHGRADGTSDAVCSLCGWCPNQNRRIPR